MRSWSPMPALLRWSCWWFGCRPDYERGVFLAADHCVPCSRCGARDTAYGDRVGDTRHNRFLNRLRHWGARVFPAPCPDCGKRFGEHRSCDVLPF